MQERRHRLSSSVSALLFHDALRCQSWAAGLSVASSPFSADGAKAGVASSSPAVDVVAGLLHFSSPRFLVDAQTAVHAESGRLTSYALGAITRSTASPLDFPRATLGVRLADKGELSVGGSAASAGLQSPLPSPPPCVVSSTAVYAQCPTVEWRLYAATDGVVSASLHRRLLPGLEVEAAVTSQSGSAEAAKGGGAERKTAVGLSIALG